MNLMESILRSWIPFALTVLSILIISALRRRAHHRGQLPPGPRPLPIIGNLHQIRGHMLHRFFAGLAKTFGPVLTLRLGQSTTIVVSSPEMAREAFQKNDLAFSSRSLPDALRTLGFHESSIVWLPGGNQVWKNLRKICTTELFTSRGLNRTQSLRRQKVRELIAYVSECCASQTPVDIGRVLSTTTLNLMSNTTFSVDFASLTSESKPEFIDLVEKIMEEAGQPNPSDYFPWLRAMDLLGRRRRMTSYFKKINAVFDEQIDRRMRARNRSKEAAGELVTTSFHDQEDFLDALLFGFKLDRPTMRTLFIDLFTAGTHTSSITVEWAMAELIRNPRVMERARAEIATVIAGGGSTRREVEESDIEKLHYLQGVVKETFRLHPPAPLLLPHTAQSSVRLGPYVVPEGARLFVNAWAMGRDSTLWHNPDVFMPERFLLLEKDADFSGRDFTLMPFGAGRRICVGIPLAFRMVHLMLASLIQRFDWKLPDGMDPAESMDMSESLGITLVMSVPLRAIPVATKYTV